MNFRQSLFWDVDPKTINIKNTRPISLKGILDFGRDKEVRWLWQTYNRPQLKKVVSASRNLRPQTKALWTLLLKSK